MTKKNLLILLSFLLAGFLISCGTDQKVTDTSESVTVTQTAETEISSEETTKGEAPEPVDYAALTGDQIGDDLYLMNCGDTMPAHSQVLSASIADDRLAAAAAVGDSDELHVFIYDYRTLQWTDHNLYKTVQLLSDRASGLYEGCTVICLNEGCYMVFQGSLTFYDRDFNETASFEIGNNAEYIDNGVFIAVFNDRCLRILYPDGTEKDYETDAAISMLKGMDEDQVILYNTDEYSLHTFTAVDIESGEETASGIVSGSWDYTDGMFIKTDKNSEKDIYTADGDGLIYYLTPEELPAKRIADGFIAYKYSTDSMTDEEGNCMSTILSLYTDESSVAIDSVLLRNDGSLWISSLACADGWALFTSIAENGGPRFYLWHIGSGDGTGETPEKIEVDNPNEEGVRRFGDLTFFTEKKYPDASEVLTVPGNNYGIGLYYGDNVYDTDFSDYVVVKSVDETALTAAEDTVKTFFSHLPEGFTDELLALFGGFDIYLVDDIMPNTGDSIESVAAFTNIIDDRYVMVIDINMSGLESNIAHEFLHQVDRCIQTMDEDAWDGWSDLNPDGFSYPDAYHTGDGEEINDLTSPEYTSADELSWSDPNRIYFIDGYGKVNEMEDRARVFEYLFTGDSTWMVQYLSENIMNKARLLCSTIRRYFPSVNKAADVWWERNLETTAESDAAG